MRKVRHAISPPARVHWDVVVSSAGKLVVGWTDDGYACRSSYVKGRRATEIVADWRIEWPTTEFKKAEVTREIEEAAILIVGSRFRFDVYRTVLRVLPGKVATYGIIAERAGYACASRAVGVTCAENPLRHLVPTYRVLGGDGALKDVALGIELQQKLLDAELNAAGGV